MKKEYTFIFIAGLFILGYVLDTVVNPLPLNLATPYHFLDPQYITKYPFTAASTFIKAVAMFMTPLWLLSFVDISKMAKGAILLVLAGLAQLYALQEVATGDQIIPLEWSLSLAVAGMVLLVPAILFLIAGLFSSAHRSISDATKAGDPFEDEGSEEE